MVSIYGWRLVYTFLYTIINGNGIASFVQKKKSFEILHSKKNFLMCMHLALLLPSPFVRMYYVDGPMAYNHYITMTQYPPPTRVSLKIEHRSWLLFSHLSALFRNTFKKVSSQMQVHSLRQHINQRLHSKYSWNIAILLQFIFCRKKTIFFLLFVFRVMYFLWLLWSIEGLIFCHSSWSWKSQGKNIEFILCNFVATL